MQHRDQISQDQQRRQYFSDFGDMFGDRHVRKMAKEDMEVRFDSYKRQSILEHSHVRNLKKRNNFRKMKMILPFVSTPSFINSSNDTLSSNTFRVLTATISRLP